MEKWPRPMANGPRPNGPSQSPLCNGPSKRSLTKGPVASPASILNGLTKTPVTLFFWNILSSILLPMFVSISLKTYNALLEVSHSVIYQSHSYRLTQ